MFNAFHANDLLLSMLSTLTGDEADLEPVRDAFETTKGDFRAKFTAAVQARLAQLAAPEVFIDLPEHPEQLRNPDLEKLVRAAPYGFLHSQPSKDELLGHVEGIRRRQQRRPAWIPRIDRDGNPLPVSAAGSTEAEQDRPLVITALAEIGEIAVEFPGWEDRPEVAMEPGGIGEWEFALFSVLGFVEDDAAARTIVISAAANEALVPNEARWWSSEPLAPVPGTQDPGVASELLATSATLGGLPVTDNTAEGYEAIVDALISAGDWRYAPEWLLETSDPSDGTAGLTISRAAIAGWADEDNSGIVMYVYGGALSTTEGLFGAPGPLHSYVLAATRSADGTDAVGAVHRVIWTCPGEQWCHRGGCPDADFPELAALLTPIVTAARAAQVASNGASGPWAEAYEQLYGDHDGTEYADRIIEILSMMLTGAGWVELDESTWDGGLEQVLIRRGEHCLTVTYDPVTRQVQLVDGKNELDTTLQILAEDGVIIDDGTVDRVNTDQDVVERWGAELLTAADDLRHGRLKELPQLVFPTQITVLGLHPHADGDLRGPHAPELAEHQLGTLLRALGLLTRHEPQPHEPSNR